MYLTNPGILIIFLALAVAGATIWGALRQKRLPRVFFILRLASLLILLFLIFEPTFSVFEKKAKPYVAVLVDTSKSMNFSNRLADVKKFINRNYPSLRGSFETDFYQFSKIPAPFTADKLSSIEANGDSTNIYRCLEQVAGSKNYDGIMLFSDGIDNSPSSEQEGAPKIPVIAFSGDEKEAPKDASVASIRVSDFIFKNIPAEVTAGIYASGCNGETLDIRLMRDKEIVASKQLTVDKPYDEVTFEFTSSRLGVETYTIEIAPVPGETILSNNTRSFTVETIREKIRILYICGQPSPEYYYLRYFLKSNPSIELVSFVILRDPEDVEVVPDEQLSLIPFPQNEIFTKDLFDYDIFIIENFNYARFDIPSYFLANIKRFVVEKGGGFLMMGGGNAFGKGAYAGTAIEEILPVTLDKPEDESVRDLFKLKFVNLNHPITAIPEENAGGLDSRAWNELPEIDGCNRLGQKPGSTVIAVHPSIKVGDKPLVCIACQEAGKGKTMAMGINTTWRWLLRGAEDGKSAALYTKFWENTVYWLSGSQQSKELRISLTQKNYLQGEEINFKVLVLNDTLRKKKPFVTVTDPFSKITQIENLRPIPQGWSGSLTPSLPGEYVISGQLEKGRGLGNNRIIIEDKKHFEVSSDVSSEEYKLQANPQLLKDLADSTGGLYFSNLDNFPQKEITSLLTKNEKPVVKKRTVLAANPLFYFAILILLLTEWVIRKFKGLI